jgi:hypothetical protein
LIFFFESLPVFYYYFLNIRYWLYIYNI